MALLPAPITDPDTIRSLIPQRAPFVQVDRLDHFSEHEAIAGLLIDKDNILVEDGVLSPAGLIEHMAQTIALHTGYQCFLDKVPTPTGYIGAMKDVMITDRPAVGTALLTEAKLLSQFMQVTRVELKVKQDDKIIASCIMTTVIVDI